MQVVVLLFYYSIRKRGASRWFFIAFDQEPCQVNLSPI